MERLMPVVISVLSWFSVKAFLPNHQKAFSWQKFFILMLPRMERSVLTRWRKTGSLTTVWSTFCWYALFTALQLTHWLYYFFFSSICLVSLSGLLGDKWQQWHGRWFSVQQVRTWHHSGIKHVYIWLVTGCVVLKQHLNEKWELFAQLMYDDPVPVLFWLYVIC